jgi:hypothetical protein
LSQFDPRERATCLQYFDDVLAGFLDLAEEVFALYGEDLLSLRQDLDEALGDEGSIDVDKAALFEVETSSITRSF